MRISTFSALAAALLLPAAAPAAVFDGKSDVLCATLEAVQCVSAPGEDHICARGAASGLNVPQFVKVDFGASRVTSTRESGTSRTSTIATVSRGNGHLILQGVDDGHGWTVVIEENTGRMTASAIGDEEGVMVFGACTQL